MRSHGRRRARFYGCAAYHERGRHVCTNRFEVSSDDADGIVLEAQWDDVVTPDIIRRPSTVRSRFSVSTLMTGDASGSSQSSTRLRKREGCSCEVRFNGRRGSGLVEVTPNVPAAAQTPRTSPMR